MVPLIAALFLLPQNAPVLSTTPQSTSVPGLTTRSSDADSTVPANVQVLYTTHATGVQIYTCAAQPNGSAQWTLQAPDAVLTMLGNTLPVGHHGAGPAWTWFDGSAITGKVQASAPSGAPGSIPSLLVATTPLPGSVGVLNLVTFVRRSRTEGGAAPATPCDPASSSPVRVPYTATYTFYMPYTEVAPDGGVYVHVKP